jgi:hypothetical protein
MRSLKVLLACLVVGLVCLVTSSSTQRALTSSIAHPDLTWLAAGDSYSSGQGLPDRSGSCAQADPQDGLGPAAWGVMAAQALANSHQLSLAAPVHLVACTGALTYQFFNGTGGHSPHPPEWTPANGKFDVVSFTFGGDNLHFTSFIEDCMLHSSCPSESQEEQKIDNLSSTYLPFLTKVANKVVVHGGQVIVVGYPLIMARPQAWPPADQLVHDLYLMGRGEAKEIRTLAVKLNTMLATDVAKANANKPNGVHFTFISLTSPDPKLGIDPGDPYLFTGHELGSGQQWLNGLEVGSNHGAGTLVSCPSITWELVPALAISGSPELATGLAGLDLACGVASVISPDTTFHPDVAGNSAMAHLVEQAFPHLNWSGFSVAPTTTSQAPQHQASSTTNSSSPQPTPTVGTWSQGPDVPPLPASWGLYQLYLFSADCANSSYCVALGGSYLESSAVAPAPTIVYIYQNGSWLAPTELPNTANLHGNPNINVDCSATLGQCEIVNSNGEGWVYNSGSWTGPSSLNFAPQSSPSTPSLATLPSDQQQVASCSFSGSFCVAIGYLAGIDGASVSQNFAYQYVSGQWSLIYSFPPSNWGLGAISCPTSSFCLGAGGAGDMDAGPYVVFYRD